MNFYKIKFFYKFHQVSLECKDLLDICAAELQYLLKREDCPPIETSFAYGFSFPKSIFTLMPNI